MKTILCIFLAPYVVASGWMATPVVALGETPNSHAFVTTATRPRLLRKPSAVESSLMREQDRVQNIPKSALEQDTWRALDEAIAWSATAAPSSFSFSLSYSMSMSMPYWGDWTDDAVAGASTTTSTANDQNNSQSTSSSSSSSSSTLKNGSSLSSIPNANRVGTNRLLSMAGLIALVVAIAATLLALALLVLYHRKHGAAASRGVFSLMNDDDSSVFQGFASG